MTLYTEPMSTELTRETCPEKTFRPQQFYGVPRANSATRSRPCTTGASSTLSPLTGGIEHIPVWTACRVATDGKGNWQAQRFVRRPNASSPRSRTEARRNAHVLGGPGRLTGGPSECASCYMRQVGSRTVRTAFNESQSDPRT